MKAWSRYIVTQWHDEHPIKRMYVYTNEVTAERVTGQVTTDNDPFPSTSSWTRDRADKWTWTESDTRLPKKNR